MEAIIHFGIKCEECQTFPISGIRYKCIQCESYNLCEKCEEKYGQNHGHVLLKLRNVNQNDMYQKKYNDQDNKLKAPKVNTHITFKINSSLSFKTLNNNNCIRIPVKLINNGRTNWPSPCFFTCQDESEIKGEKHKINEFEVQPGKLVSFNLKLDLSKINKTGNYTSVYCLQDENGVQIGPKITFTVNDVFEERLKLKPYYCIKKLNIVNDDIKPITTEQLLSKKL